LNEAVRILQLLPNVADHVWSFRAKVFAVSPLKVLLDRITKATSLSIVHWLGGGNQNRFDMIQDVTNIRMYCRFFSFELAGSEDRSYPKP
jgi:hypothetical protein